MTRAPINSNDILAEMSPERRAKVLARARQLIAEERALRHLREARKLTQETMAELLHIKQASVSKIESRTDMLLSTLRSYVAAMGGSLHLVVEFPDGAVELSSLSEVRLSWTSATTVSVTPPAVPAQSQAGPRLVVTGGSPVYPLLPETI
jgi:DNA-binding XRE family transcriptional regulator